MPRGDGAAEAEAALVAAAGAFGAAAVEAVLVANARLDPNKFCEAGAAIERIDAAPAGASLTLVGWLLEGWVHFSDFCETD